MTIEDLKNDISSVLEADGCSAEFYFLLDTDGGMSVKLVDINEQDHIELGRMFIDGASEKIVNNEDLSLLSLSGADERQNAIYHYDLDEVPVGIQFLKTIIESEDIESVNLDDDCLSNLEGILILVGNEEHQLAIYKHQYPITLLQKGSGFNLVKPRNGNRFSKLETDILKINSKFEFIKINGEYYILDIKALEKFFGFHDAIKNVAEIGVENISSSDLVMNCEVFTRRLDDISFSRKLVRSASNSPVLGEVSNDEIISFTQEHPSLKGRFKYSDDGTQLNLTTKVSQDLFLKLLNDDYLQSELTNRLYDSIAKDNVTAEVETA
mgnify:CR=1 FL=1